MTDKKISELGVITQGDIASGDWVAVVDSSENATKKYNFGDIKTDVTDFFDSTDTFTAGTYVRTLAEGFAHRAVDTGGHVTNVSGQAFVKIWDAPQTTYTIGDGVSSGTNFTPASNTMFYGNGDLLKHQAENATGQSQLFTVENVTDVKISSFEVDGQSATRNAFTLRGVIERITLRDLYLYDLENFAIQYADAETNPTLANFDGLWLENIEIGGTVGPVGAGSGINLFPRSQNGTVPASKNAFLNNIKIDVSQGQASQANHGPQAFKFNNVDGIYGTNWVGKGGDVACIIISNGCRAVRLNNVSSEFSNRGLQIDTANNVATTITQDIEVHGFRYKKDGIDGDGYGVYLQGSPIGVRLIGGQINGDFVIGSATATDNLQGLEVSNYRLSGARFRMLDPGVVTTNVYGAVFKDITIDGGGSGIQFDMPFENRGFDRSVFSEMKSYNAVANFVQNFGSGNVFQNLLMKDASAGTNTAVITDFGDKTEVDGVEIDGGAVDFWVRKRGGDGLTIKNIKGSPVGDGFRFENQENSDVPVGNLKLQSEIIDLSGAAVTDEPFFVASKDTYILGVSFLYTEASSADAGVQMRLRVNGGTRVNYTSEASQAVGDQTNYINTIGTRSFGNRKVSAGDILQFQCDGGKVGAGEVVIVVSMIEVT